jgi:hypothetical protein
MFSIFPVIYIFGRVGRFVSVVSFRSFRWFRPFRFGRFVSTFRLLDSFSTCRFLRNLDSPPFDYRAKFLAGKKNNTCGGGWRRLLYVVH